MPHRVLRAALLDAVSGCCGVEDAERVVDRLIAMGVQFPTKVITEAVELDAIPDGSAVIVGHLQDPAKLPSVGVKQQYAIQFAGDDRPWPFHDPNVEPPVPCYVLWMADDAIEELRGGQQ